MPGMWSERVSVMFGLGAYLARHVGLRMPEGKHQLTTEQSRAEQSAAQHSAVRCCEGVVPNDCSPLLLSLFFLFNSDLLLFPEACGGFTGQGAVLYMVLDMFVTCITRRAKGERERDRKGVGVATAKEKETEQEREQEKEMKKVTPHCDEMIPCATRPT